MARKPGDIQLLKPAVADAIHDTLREGMESDELIKRLAAIVRAQAMVLAEERRCEALEKKLSDAGREQEAARRWHHRLKREARQ